MTMESSAWSSIALPLPGAVTSTTNYLWVPNTNESTLSRWDASTGTELGRVSGNAAGERLGSLGVTNLGTNYIIRSPDANGAGGVAQGGAVIMAGGATGTELGRVSGASASERLGTSVNTSFSFGSSNYLILSTLADVGGNVDAGAAILASGATGTEIGRVSGNAANEQLGNLGVAVALPEPARAVEQQARVFAELRGHAGVSLIGVA